MTEQWKDIVGYEEYYQVSDQGNIKSVKKYVTNSRNAKYKVLRRERILKNISDGKGYFRVNLWKENKIKLFFVHQLVAKAFIPNPENKREVNHKKGIKTDNRASELEWATSLENNQHAHKIGLNKSDGENNPMAVLTKTKAVKIKELFNAGVPVIKIQKENFPEYQYHTVYAVCTKRSWK